MSCPNTCATTGRDYRRMTTQKRNLILQVCSHTHSLNEQGISIKNTYIAAFESKSKTRTKEIRNLKNRIGKLSVRLNRLQKGSPSNRKSYPKLDALETDFNALKSSHLQLSAKIVLEDQETREVMNQFQERFKQLGETLEKIIGDRPRLTLEDEIPASDESEDPCLEVEQSMSACLAHTWHQINKVITLPFTWPGYAKFFAQFIYAPPSHAELLSSWTSERSALQLKLESLISQQKASSFEQEPAWAHLAKSCFAFLHDGYTYELCLFDKIKQKKIGQGDTDMGSFERWDGPLKMIYTHGQVCWNGPERSVILSLTCGTENKILSVKEPSKCEYEMEFTSPAACHERDLPRVEYNQRVDL